MKFPILFGLVFALSSTLVSASDWRHFQLASTNGTKINIDFQFDPDNGNTISASNVWVNVTLPPGSDCNVPVRALLLTTPSYGSTTIQTLDLYLAGGSSEGCRFTNAQPAHLLIANHGGSIAQEIAVVVRGTWLVDPVTGKHNFTFKP